MILDKNFAYHVVLAKTFCKIYAKINRVAMVLKFIHWILYKQWTSEIHFHYLKKIGVNVKFSH